MKIVLVSPYDLGVPGGVQSHVLDLARRLRDVGEQVVVLGPGRGQHHRGVGWTQNVPFNGSVAPIALGPGAWANTRHRLSQLQPDVIHVHEPFVPAVGLAAATSRVAPVVATFHAWSASDRLYRAARPVVRSVLNRAEVLIAVSEPAAAYHAGALGVSPNRFTVVPNGVDVARFTDARPLPRLTTDPHRPTLVFLGRLEPRKGLAVLLRAFVQLAPRHQGLKLVVAGEGPEAERVDELVPAEHRDDVVLLGRVDDDEVPQTYAAADVYVAPALGGESFGIVLLEAMAAGRPVVASDIPGYRAVLRQSGAGVLVPPDDAEALTTVLDEILRDPARREAMAEAGRRAVSTYDWPVVTEQLQGHYRRAVDAA